ncbi:hypothetical protein Pcinc_038060 [Petrolisthes cinctipes]|uniref:Uncharacterized protein n=1 Tax=Petrolisthes cinctipes TaxID=88211 RepID=A0AAE1BUR7_PETCI|nr:hypothetical protein Pcinc_038060 [Petrolisthes cinctipes]
MLHYVSFVSNRGGGGGEGQFWGGMGEGGRDIDGDCGGGKEKRKGWREIHYSGLKGGKERLWCGLKGGKERQEKRNRGTLVWTEWEKGTGEK